ncbi:MAG: SLC13 family permease [Caldilineaceae bacterium]|nr:SLC13 family permease [Caldilineaceae bacterium]
MSGDQILLILIIVGATTLFMTRWLSTEVTALLIIVTLGMTGLLSPEEALSGFSSTAMVTVAAMFILSGGLLRTGALETMTAFLARFARGSLRRLLGSVGLIAGGASAFINNTPVVVMMVPVLLSLSAQLRLRPSKLLIPLSYFSILGGTMTLLGTSTNILLDDLYRKAGGPGFGIFDFLPLGLIFTAIGLVYVVTIGVRLLPARAPLYDLTAGANQNTYITELWLTGESNIVGLPADRAFERIATMDRTQSATLQRSHRRIQNTQPRARNRAQDDQKSVELLQLFRDGRIYRAEETARLVLASGDVLIVAGTPGEIARFVETTDSHLAPVLADGTRVPVDDIERKVCEAVVLPDSPYNGQLIGELKLNELFGVRIMGLQHRGRQFVTGLREMRLASGDVLLLQGRQPGLHQASDQGKLMMVEGVERGILRTNKNRTALIIMVAVVALAALTDLPIALLALTGAALMIVLKCLRVEEALRALDAGTLLLLAGTIPLGLAMETTGLAQMAVDLLLRVLGDAGPVLILSCFYLLTNLLTQLLSNNAVAVLLLPIGLNLAASVGVSPTPFLMAIAFGASASFLTPMGYQTNAIVMGPGGYSFGDYLRIGLPLSIIMWLVASAMIPILYPF